MLNPLAGSEILPEGPAPRLALEIAQRHRDDRTRTLISPVRPRGGAARLEHAEQLRLQIERQFADPSTNVPPKPPRTIPLGGPPRR
jgi:hypothetical protein